MDVSQAYLYLLPPPKQEEQGPNDIGPFAHSLGLEALARVNQWQRIARGIHADLAFHPCCMFQQ